MKYNVLSECIITVMSNLQLKTKMQIQIIQLRSGNAGNAVQYRHVFHAGAVILKQHGLRGFYQGLPATWLRNTPAFGIYFGEYRFRTG